MSHPLDWSFSLNREDISRRIARRDQISDEIAKLQSELEAETKWLEAISLILPPPFAASLGLGQSNNEGAERGSNSVWRRAAEAVLNDAPRGLLPKEIAQIIREEGEAEAKERIARNPNGLYNILSKMLEDGQVIKHRDKFYSSQLYDALSKSGEIEEDADETGMTGVNAAIYGLINLHGPLPPKTIMEALRNHEEFKQRVGKNPQYGYSAIARLVRQGHIEKFGDRYRLRSQENGASDVSPSNAPDAGSAQDIFG